MYMFILPGANYCVVLENTYTRWNLDRINVCSILIPNMEHSLTH
jgi:hypothetical protein